MIRVTGDRNAFGVQGVRFWVNPRHVIAVVPRPAEYGEGYVGSTIHLSDGEHVDVTEDAEFLANNMSASEGGR